MNILKWDIRDYKIHPIEFFWIVNVLIHELDILYTHEPYLLSQAGKC
jgi:hypothetical protein